VSPGEPLDGMVAAPAGGRVFGVDVWAGLADAAPSGRVRLDAIARWLQDAAYADVADAGFADRAAWIVRRSRIRVQRFPRFADDLTVRTFCSGLGRFWAERRTTVSGAGALVEAVAIWVHLDRETLRPTRFDPETLTLFRTSAGDRQVKARLRHPGPPDDAARAPWRFLATDLDIAGHVNNAAYWQVVEPELQAAAEPEQVDAEIEYRTPASAGDAVLLRGDGRLWLADPGGEVLASAVLDARRDG
jgi:acyl-ACP thioesterase